MSDPLKDLAIRQASSGIVDMTKDWKINWKGRPESTNIEDRRGSSDNGLEIAKQILNNTGTSNVFFPLPKNRPDPNEVLKQREDVWVSNAATDAAEQDYKNQHYGLPYEKDYGLPFGYDFKKFESTFEKEVPKQEFILDSFKRARSVGFPIHPLQPVLDTMSSVTFSDQGYEDN